MNGKLEMNVWIGLYGFAQIFINANFIVVEFDSFNNSSSNGNYGYFELKNIDKYFVS